MANDLSTARTIPTNNLTANRPPNQHSNVTTNQHPPKKAKGPAKIDGVKPDEVKFTEKAKQVHAQRVAAKTQKAAQLRAEIAEMSKLKKAAMVAHQQNLKDNLNNPEVAKKMKADFKAAHKKFENAKKAKIAQLNNLLGIKPKKPNKPIMQKLTKAVSNLGKTIKKLSPLKKGLIGAGVVVAGAGTAVSVKNAKAKKAEFNIDA